jgi:hypothetical protein
MPGTGSFDLSVQPLYLFQAGKSEVLELHGLSSLGSVVFLLTIASSSVISSGAAGAGIIDFTVEMCDAHGPEAEILPAS